MEKTKNGSAVLGTDIPKPLTLEEVKGYVKRDLASTINMLDAIYRDQPTTDMLSEILYGRYLNSKHKEELEKQAKLDI